MPSESGQGSIHAENTQITRNCSVGFLNLMRMGMLHRVPVDEGVVKEVKLDHIIIDGPPHGDIVTGEGWMSQWDYRRHREGVERCKELIRHGESIRPILVYRLEQPIDGKPYLRIDGFKRCHAYKELGHEQVTAQIIDRCVHGGQHRMSWLTD